MNSPSLRLAELRRTVAPAHLPESVRRVILDRLADLGPLLDRCHDRGELLDLTKDCIQLPKWLTATPASCPTVAFQTLVNDRLLTLAPFAAALTAPMASSIVRRRYDSWLGLIVLCCCQLHVRGNHDSAISAALREIRLIATDAKHRPILTLLPPIEGDRYLYDLSRQLQTVRVNGRKLPNVQQNGIAYLSVVIHSCATGRPGIRRERTHNATQLQAAQPEPGIVTNQIDPGFDSDLTLVRLERVDADADRLDEPSQTTATVTLRYNDPSLRNKELALKALQGRRLAEQFSTQQNSLRCAYDQATEFDISHLVSNCLKQLARGDELAGWMLLSLLTGRDVTRLREPTQTALEFVKGHPCLVLHHQVPAGQQPDNLNALLPLVKHLLQLPLPRQLGSWLETVRSNRTLPEPSEIRARLKIINQAHGTRLAPGMITRCFAHWLMNDGVDRAVIALLRGESHKTRPALSYAQQKPAKVLTCYYRYVEAVFGMARKQPQLPPLQDTRLPIGSRLHLPPKLLHNAFSLLAKRIASNRSTLDFHNGYVSYVWALLAFATGHRDVNAPMGLLTDYNPYQRSWWISDKERRQGLSARTVIIPKTAALQVDLYLDHLRNLARYHRLLNPAITERCQQALTGQANLLFGFLEKDGTALPCDLTPTLVTNLLNGHLPWARNWARHHLRSELANRSVNPELIDGWMGHEEIGEEAVGRHSSLSMSQFRGLAEIIESILTEHRIEAVAGWQTH